MRSVSEHEYTTYPRRFIAYKWYKSLLVGVIFIPLSLICEIAVAAIAKLAFGTSIISAGYDDMDFFSAAGALSNGLSAAAPILCIIIAAMIVKDRPVSSYYSSMGGWRWGAFIKTMAAAVIILGIPNIAYHIMHGRTGDIRFTLLGFIALTLLAPLQGVAEELTYRGYYMQTVSSWFKLPVAGIIVQVILFTLVHPYNVIGKVEIAASALLYALVCVISRGLEAGSALHIANNMSEIYIVGLGFGSISAEQTVPDVAFNLCFKILFLLFIIYADKRLHWFDKVKYDDVAAFNAKIKSAAKQ